jgi:protein-disulfide isomerase
MTTAFLIAMAAAQLATAAPPPPAPASDDAVEIVLYSDFQCPFCAAFAGAFRDVQSKGVDGVKTTVVFKNFPLSIHPAAPLAHQAAAAAAEQGKFWEMHDLLFANQRKAQREDLLGYAQQLGLDMKRFKADMDGERLKQRIASDLNEGEKRGINGTPTFFVNGRAYVGTKSVAQLRQLVVDEQRRTRALREIGDSLISKGPSDARVTIEFFADLLSPVTPPTVAVLTGVMQTYPSDVRVQFRNFPLSFHPQAPLAHEAAMIAARAGHFWEFVEYALSHQSTLREADLVALAGKLGMDSAAFAAALADHRYAPRVEADVASGFRKGVRGSPVILVNGARIDGVPSVEALTGLIKSALAQAADKRSQF